MEWENAGGKVMLLDLLRKWASLLDFLLQEVKLLKKNKMRYLQSLVMPAFPAPLPPQVG